MMSNPRMRKPAAAGCDMRSRSRGPTKAAGDAAPCNAPKPPPSRSKSKLSKSIRFDLDNALVGVSACLLFNSNNDVFMLLHFLKFDMVVF